MTITASRSLKGVPSKNLEVIGQWGNTRATETVVLTEVEFIELQAAGALEHSTHYLICKSIATSEQLKALAIQQHYLQS